MSLAAMREANRRCHGAAVVPHYRFDRARVVVALEADFLGTWLAPVEFARQWARRRTEGRDRRFHVQFESGMSVTGSNADLRLAVAPSELGAIAVALLAAVGRRVGDAGLVGPAVAGPGRVDTARRRDRADRRGAGAQPRRIAGGVGQRRRGHADRGGEAERRRWATPARPSILARPSLQRQGDDTALPALIDDMNRGTVHALLLWGANPVYDHPDGVAFRAALRRSRSRSRSPTRRDETSAHVHAVCPDHHFLEAWGDAEPVAGTSACGSR